MTTVFTDAPDQPGLHALVIGVGNYGNAVTDPVLVSAVPSATAIAQWIYGEYQNANAPLRSLEVLLSPPKQKTKRTALTLNAGATRPALTVNVERALIGFERTQNTHKAFGIKAALWSWYQRCNLHFGNVALLYLCGHGAEIISDPHFFAEGFDTTDPMGALQSAINLRQLVVAMTQVRARRQLLLFDCCRDHPSWGIGFTHPAGGPLTANPDLLLPGTPRLRATHLYAAATGLRARAASPPSISRFAEGLLHVFRGPACEANPVAAATPSVLTTNIATAIEDLVHAGVLGSWSDEGPSPGANDRFEFHTPARPTVPVVLDTGPLASGETVQLDGSTCVPLNGGSNRWSAWCSTGVHSAAVVDANGSIVRSCDVIATPTHALRSL